MADRKQVESSWKGDEYECEELHLIRGISSSMQGNIHSSLFFICFRNSDSYIVKIKQIKVTHNVGMAVHILFKTHSMTIR